MGMQGSQLLGAESVWGPARVSSRHAGTGASHTCRVTTPIAPAASCPSLPGNHNRPLVTTIHHPLHLHSSSAVPYQYRSFTAIMKTAILLAAGALASPAVAGVHKMKLQKVPLSEQLVSHIIAAGSGDTISQLPEIRKHPGARKGAWPEVHGHQA